MTITFHYDGPAEDLARRELLGRELASHHDAALRGFGRRAAADWIVELGPTLLFDTAGLRLIDRALRRYSGGAARLDIELAVDDVVFREYYSLGAARFGSGRVPLPIVARRRGMDGPGETLTIALPATREPVPLPPALAPPIETGVPQALLMPWHGPFDLLFANQIALVSEIRRRVQRSPAAWIKALFRGSGVRAATQRLARAYASVHPTAEVHPTAVLEGAIVGARARVGAHCVVRYGIVAADARLHDGAKVELSIVGEGAWLMHDLVLFRSVAERGTFLIHGPYQFSCFERASGAFATILMDYRPDGRPIQVKTPNGLRPYGGVFLGSVLSEGARTLGGCLLAPGRVVPPGAWLSADPDSVHRLEDEDVPAQRPLPPRASRRRAAG